MKNGLIAALAALVFCVSMGCSDDPPAVRVRNDFSKKANTQISPAGGPTFNINDTEPGTTTAYQGLAEGKHAVKVSLQGESTAPAGEFTAKVNTNYTIVITNTTPPSLRFDASDQ